MNSRYYYRLSIDELIPRLKYLASENNITIKVHKSKIYLIKRRFYHPLQRIFKGEILQLQNNTAIEGKFGYSIAFSIFYTLFLTFLLFQNILAVIAIKNYNEKIVVTLFFVIMYFVISMIFVTGKICFRKEEDSVTSLLMRCQVDTW